RTAATFVSVRRPGDDDWTAALLEHIDAATGIVAVPHCHWTDGGLIDLEAVAAACRRVGAALCVDRTQSVRALPLDLKALDPGFPGRRRLQVAARPLQPGVPLRRPALAARPPDRAQLDRAQGIRGFRGPGQLPARIPGRRAPLRRRRAQQLRAYARR